MGHAIDIRDCPLGFVILSHGDSDQLLRLMHTLNKLYSNPPIACHHDFFQNHLDVNAFPPNVRFVEPSVRTSWGRISVVTAMLAALRLLYSNSDPTWFVLLSASDYPIRPAGDVLEELDHSPYDVYLDARPVRNGDLASATLSCDTNTSLGHFGSTDFARIRWKFYFGMEIWLPILRYRPKWRLGRYTIRPAIAARTPYRSDFACFFGDHWFTGNRRAASILLRPTADHVRLTKHLATRPQVDETYYQTVLCNIPGLKICRDNKRYTAWDGGSSHPVNLSPEHVGAAMASGAHFARKFEPGAASLDMVDKILIPAR